MARVVVVGGGFAGMACAARLAAARHDVVVLERGPRPGGRLLPVVQDGFTWDRSTASLALPAVVRDLFGSTGPPLERSLVLKPLPVLRRHMFAERDFPEGNGRVTLDLPGGSRAAGVSDLVERAFDRWRPEGGMAALADALVERLARRRVDVRCGVAALDAVRDGDRVTGVRCADGETVSADVVVQAAPQPPTSLASRAAVTPALPAARTYVGMRGEALPALPAETFVHGDPLVLVRTGGSAPAGCTGWSLEHHAGAGDVLATLARRGLDVRDAVVTRLDVSPAEVVRQADGSPAGMRWQGWRSGLSRPTATTAVRGLLRAGSGVHPGPGLTAEGLGAAQLAALVGPA